MKKRNVLWVSEASFLRTGFATQSKAILEWLYKNRPDLNIVELGSYAASDDPRADGLPWKFYGATPDGKDPIENQIAQTYHGQFGAAVFNKILLDEQIEIVIDHRDLWFMSWQLESPFRKNFHLIWQPTVDSEPQQRGWIDDCKKADVVCALSRYGKEVLERESDIKVFDIVRSGIDPDIFVFKDKKECRKKLGLPENANILLSVMRNQKRKLFPDLLEVFAKTLQKFAANDKLDLYKNTFLYLHTSYPDVGFDIGKHIVQNGLSSKVFLTYLCKGCRHVWADFWQTELTTCPRCKQLMGFLPNTGIGIESQELCDVYNAADLYIQHSIAEGLGIPLVEAKACGIPCLATNYTAMVELVETEGCEPIEVERYFHESLQETQQIRCLPDNADAVKKIYRFFTQPKEQWTAYKDVLRKDAIENYSYERAAKIFAKAIDSLPLKDLDRTWFNPDGRFLPNRFVPPNNLNNADFVDWYIDNVWQRPYMKRSDMRDKWVRSINIGYSMDSHGREPFDKEKFHNRMMNIVAEQNYWERRRLAKFGIEQEQFIDWEQV